MCLCPIRLRHFTHFYQSLTRSSSPPLSLPAKPPSPVQLTVPVLNVPGEATIGIGARRAVDDESNMSGERSRARKLSIRGQYDRQRRKRKDSSPHYSVGSGPSTPGSAAEDGSQQPSTTKRLKTTTEGETPSLLLRMGHAQHLSVPAAGWKKSKSRSPPAVQSQRSDSSGRSPAGLPDVSLGISIKGAARSHSHSHTHSLLERIQGDGT